MIEKGSSPGNLPGGNPVGFPGQDARNLETLLVMAYKVKLKEIPFYEDGRIRPPKAGLPGEIIINAPLRGNIL